MTTQGPYERRVHYDIAGVKVDDQVYIHAHVVALTNRNNKHFSRSYTPMKLSLLVALIGGILLAIFN